MSLPIHLPAAVVETILTHLAALLLTGAQGNMEAARQAAAQILAAYHPQTEDELRVAANIVSFSLHALEALAQAATPNLPITRILRLRGNAVSLNREATKAERRLAQLQKARQQAIPAEARPEPAAPPPESRPQTPPARPTITKTPAITKTKNQTWTQSYQDRQRDLRIAASIKKAETIAAAHAATRNPGAVAHARQPHAR